MKLIDKANFRGEKFDNAPVNKEAYIWLITEGKSTYLLKRGWYRVAVKSEPRSEISTQLKCKSYLYNSELIQ